ncbi:hypothetical protein TSA66_20630 [Noviherbaspirillum autotrophicum]|uniref:Uncharacterized protein n=1 Tax=Noviherbaspirillum autotrophicum TaxID=709839 RepID=A0A0C1Y6V6_9BURK|nr:hypothetical protein TSA66_20630 [Noviherbaspirillum autotrophicum]
MWRRGRPRQDDIIGRRVPGLLPHGGNDDFPLQCGGNERLNVRGWRLVEQLTAGLLMRLAQVRLRRIHAVAILHALIGGCSDPQGIDARTGICRHCQLQEQQAGKRQKRGKAASLMKPNHMRRFYQ